jgi:hypothetical protein
MKTRTFLNKAHRFLFAAVVLGSCLFAIPSFGASNQVSSNLDSGLSPNTLPVFSDFDGDNKLDQAELVSHGTQKSIHVTLGKFAWQSLSFDSGVPDRGRLVSGDIDSDGDTDLVWVSQSLPRKFVTWLGDGRGNFSIFKEPEQKHVQRALKRNSEPRLAEDTDDCAATCVVQGVTIGALQTSAYFSHIVSSERTLLPQQPVGVCAACSSVLRKRGPPSNLS